MCRKCRKVFPLVVMSNMSNCSKPKSARKSFRWRRFQNVMNNNMTSLLLGCSSEVLKGECTLQVKKTKASKKIYSQNLGRSSQKRQQDPALSAFLEISAAARCHDEVAILLYCFVKAQKCCAYLSHWYYVHLSFSWDGQVSLSGQLLAPVQTILTATTTIPLWHKQPDSR